MVLCAYNERGLIPINLKELFKAVNNDITRGFETRRISMVIVRGSNNAIPYGESIFDALDKDPDSGGYVFMCSPDAPENVIPAYCDALGTGLPTEALRLFKRQVKSFTQDTNGDKLEAFSVLHVENVSIRELIGYADSRVTRWYVNRIPATGTSDCFLYAELETPVRITGDKKCLYDGEAALLKEILQSW